MQLRTIFEHPIDRPIEGVIKADDAAGLKTEIEEYVLTDEIERRFDDFLEAYTNYQNANGAWISGWFGSGKSHMLKMLSLMLPGKEVAGLKIGAVFRGKCEDKTLVGRIDKALAIPSESILFNIDQKTDKINKKDVSALLSVFVKVFDEHCGYYGKHDRISLIPLFRRSFRCSRSATIPPSELTSQNSLDGYRVLKPIAPRSFQVFSPYRKALETGQLFFGLRS